MTADEWVARVVLVTAVEVSDAALDKMADAADERDASVARRAAGPGVVVTMDIDAKKDRGREVNAAIDWALGLVCEVGRYGDATPIDVRFMTLDAYEDEALRPDIPELASAADAAEILGVSRQRVHQLANSNPRFPKPIARVATGPLWTRSVIEWFDSVWERKAGRPAKLAAVDGSQVTPLQVASVGTVHRVAASASAHVFHDKQSADARQAGNRP